MFTYIQIYTHTGIQIHSIDIESIFGSAVLTYLQHMH